MAPRRLIIVMVLLLAFSTALAILVPGPRQPSPDTPPERPSAGSEDRPEPSRSGSGQGAPVPDRANPEKARAPGNARLVEAKVLAGGPIEQITLDRGDRLVLEVFSNRPRVISVEGAGLTDTAGPYDPARFDLLAGSRKERLIVVDLDSGRRLGLIVVR